MVSFPIHEEPNVFSDLDPNQQVLSIREPTLGKEHPDVAKTLESYIALLRRVYRESEADELETRALAIRAKQKM